MLRPLDRYRYWYRDSRNPWIETDTDTSCLGIGTFDTIPIFTSVSDLQCCERHMNLCSARHMDHCYGDFVWMTWNCWCATIWLKSSSTRNLSLFGYSSFGEKPKKPPIFHLFWKLPKIGGFWLFSKSTEPNELKFRVELDFGHTVASKKFQVIRTKSP